MKRIISLILSAFVTLPLFVSCNSVLISEKSSSSDGYADSEWLESRIGEMPENISIGTADSLGINMDNFEDDGYIIRTYCGETLLCGKNEVGLDMAVRAYARAIKYGYEIADKQYHEGRRIEKLTIAGHDISEYTVVYTHTAKPVMRDIGLTEGNGEYAAEEFVRLIKYATGVELTMSETIPNTPYISFEATDSLDEFGYTGFSYEVKNGNIIFRGSGYSGGCSNAVYYFLEKECGWNNLTFGDSNLLEADEISIPEGLSYNGTTLFNGMYTYGLFHSEYDQEHRIYSSYSPVACHGINTHGFITEVDTAWYNPCYTDEDMMEECTENVMKYVEDKVASGSVIGVTLTYVDIAQPDSQDFCQCKNCRTMVKKEGSESGPVVNFSNVVSEAVNEKHPGLQYLIFAYNLTKQPPKTIRPNELISVTFCLDGNCLNHPIYAGLCRIGTWKVEQNVTNSVILSWITTWSEICNDLRIWYYTMDGANCQFNTLDVLYDDFMYFKSLGISVLFLESEYYGHGVGRLYHDMAQYMQWNPDITKEEYYKVIQRKVDEYYGPGSYEDYMKEANLFRMASLRMGDICCWMGAGVNPDYTDYKYVADNADEVLTYINRMIEEADSYEHEKNGKRYSMMLIYESLPTRYYEALADNDTELMSHLTELYALFCERAVECGFELNNIKEGICFVHEYQPTLTEEAKINWEEIKNKLVYYFST